MSSLFNIGDKIKINKFRFFEENPPFAGYSLKSLDRNKPLAPLIEVTRDDGQTADFTQSEIIDGTLESFVTSTDTSNIILGSGQKLCFSLRNAYPGYTGNVVRVRRDIDDAQQDFTAAQVDDGTMVSFITASGASNGFVSIWYDQSPSGQNASNADNTRQPKIYDSVNGLYLVNGKPSLYFFEDGLLINDFDYGLTSNIVFNSVSKVDSTKTYNYILTHFSYNFGYQGASYDYYTSQFNDIEEIRFQYGSDSQVNLTYRSGFSVGIKNQFIVTSSFNLLEPAETEGRVLSGANFASKNFQDGEGDTTFTNSSVPLMIGGTHNSGFPYTYSSDFNLQELSIWTNNFSDNELRFIQEQTNEYYNTHTSDTLLDTNLIVNGYVSKWYDQFGTNTAVQTDQTKMPIIYQDGQVVKFNGEPALRSNGDYLEVPNSTSEFKFLHDGNPNSVFAVGAFDESNSIIGFFGTNGGGSGSIGTFLELSFGDLRVHVTKGSISNFVAKFNSTGIILPNEQFFIHLSSDADNATASERLKVSLNLDPFIQDNVEVNAPSTSNASYNLQIGAVGGNARTMKGFLQELLIFNSDQTTNKELSEYQVFYKYGYDFWFNGLEELFNTSNIYFSGE